MSDTSQGPGWWLASDGKWYPPELWTGPPDARPGRDAGPTRVADLSSRRRSLGHRASPSQPSAVYGAPSTRRSGRYSATHGQYAAATGQYPLRLRPAALRPGAATEDERPGHRVAGLCVCRGLSSLPAVAGHHLRLRRPRPDQASERPAEGRRPGPRRHHRRLRLAGARGAQHRSVRASTNDNNSGIVGPGILTGLLSLGGCHD